jgi:hypothetical protein
MQGLTNQGTLILELNRQRPGAALNLLTLAVCAKPPSKLGGMYLGGGLRTLRGESIVASGPALPDLV